MDELGIKSNIDIKAHIVNIKFNLIIGLETIKENNLTIRYPSIFSSNSKLDGLICKPCAKDESEKEGRWLSGLLKLRPPVPNYRISLK